MTSVTSTISAPFRNAGSVEVQRGTLELQSSGSDTGTYFIAGGATLNVGGGLRSLSPASVPFGAGTLLLSGGSLTVEGGALPKLDMTGGELFPGGANLLITGAFNASGGSVAAGPGFFRTEGETRVSGAITINPRWVNAGRAQIDAGANVVSTLGITNEAGREMGGAGTLDVGSATLINNGTLRAGSVNAGATGTLTISGNFQQNADGRLEVDLGGTSAGQFDVLAVSGNADARRNAGGVARAGFAPPSNSTYPIISYSSRTGDFANRTFPLGYQPFYLPPDPGRERPTRSHSAPSSMRGNPAIGSGAWENPLNWTSRASSALRDRTH